MTKQRIINEDLIGAGENPKGFTMQDRNGTGHAMGSGWNKQWDWGAMPEVPTGGPWKKGRSNRTAE